LTIIGDLYWTGRRKRTKQQQFDLILGRLQKLMQQRVSRGWKSRRENCSEAPRTSQWHIWWQGQVHLYHSGGESHSMSQHVTTCHNVACHNLSQKDTISKSIGITCLAVLWAEPAEPFLSSVGNGWNMMEPVSLCFSQDLSSYPPSDHALAILSAGNIPVVSFYFHAASISRKNDTFLSVKGTFTS
jgi:hypothetical protein